MRLALLRSLGGPSLHADEPVLLARLDATGAQPDLACRVARWLGDTPAPPAGAPACLAAIVASVAEHAGVGGPVARLAPGPHGPDVLVVREPEPAMRALVTRSAEVLAALDTGALAPSLAELAREFADLLARYRLGPSTRAIVDAAARRGVPWERLDESSLIRLGWGRNARLIRASITGATGSVAADIACDKPLASRILAAARLPVPRGEVVATVGEAVAAAQRIGGRVVVKPLYGNHGRGVSVGLEGDAAVRGAFQIARDHGRRALVEEQFEGRDFRVLVVGGRMVAAAERRPAHVVGDGRRTVAELIDVVNADPRRGDGHEKPMTRIRPDDVVLAHLESEGLGLDFVPAPGELVWMDRTANLSRGATAHDVTDSVHPAVRTVCERAARAVGLDVCGVDLVTPAVDRPLGPGSGIVEVNAAPGLRMHVAPAEGRPRDVGSAIIESLYPAGAQSRIPVIAVTGTNGKTTTTRLIAHALSAEGLVVGMTTTAGIRIGDDEIAVGDTTGPGSARVVLSDPTVDVAVLETARGGILRRGLAFDLADIAVLTNVTEDHLGQDGIRSLDDLYRIKRRIAERVREDGALVLNADDERLAALPDDPAIAGVRRRVVLFSLVSDNPRVLRHRARGGAAMFVRGGWIVEASEGREKPLVRIEDVPMTMAGAARFQIANLLAACGALRAHGVERGRVAVALRSFRAAEHNAGRANLYRLGEGYVMLDYGHNPAGYEQVCAVAEQWRRAGRPVTGIVAAPGDRPDDTIRASARVAARGFTRIVARDDVDRRGRAAGEVARLLLEEVAEVAPDIPRAHVPDAVDALRGELDAVRAGAVAVVFYEKLSPLRELLDGEGAVAVDAVPMRGARASGAGFVSRAADRVRRGAEPDLRRLADSPEFADDFSGDGGVPVLRVVDRGLDYTTDEPGDIDRIPRSPG